MKQKRTLIIAVISTIVALSALTGFFISFSTAPQTSLIRVFIDLGVLIAVIGAFIAMPKPTPLPTQEISDGLRDLARGRYEKRLDDSEEGELSGVIQAFNELAGTLCDSSDPALSPINFGAKRAAEAVIKPPIDEHHSFHPELGRVQAFNFATMGKHDLNIGAKEATWSENEPKICSTLPLQNTKDSKSKNDKDCASRGNTLDLKRSKIIVHATPPRFNPVKPKPF